MPRRRTTQRGEPNCAFDAAFAHNDLRCALGAAADLHRAALLLFLMAQERSPLCRRAAARWLSRYASETDAVTRSMLIGVAEAIAQVWRGDVEATERLLAAVGDPVLPQG